MLALLFGIGGYWAATVPLSGAVLASGSVTVAGNAKTVQHPDGGVVTQLLVNDGSFVEEGDLLLRLDDTLLRANLNIYTNRLQEAATQRSRLIAERDGLDRISWDHGVLHEHDIPVSASVEEDHASLFAARRNTLEGQANQYREQIAQYKNQLLGTEAQKQSADEQIALLEEELAGFEKLDKQGFISASEVRALRRQIAEMKGQSGEMVAELARIENAITESEIKISQTRREFVQNALAELSQTETEIRDMVQQLIATRSQIARTDIRAPVSGMVHELSMFTVGGVVAPGAPVMQIVPQTSDLNVEASVEPSSIDQIWIGQEVVSRFSAFNQRTTPELMGEVASISPSTTVDENTGLSYYKVRFTFTEGEFVKLGDVRLVPGMPVESHIRTQERTTLSYVLKPLTDNFQNALRER
ncbi:HlyD family type I secretion periplasmic adaptor subunit [Hoeflea prorocentri]|uniref:Membrane fusion protein (MFP) family protein n=1 Tax=Hoeflea prorocentri TaxID=1922333 RepID=A0A9X3ZHX1_9HYPH|nr:HlyD family type I secretion periplasmic adaptor subunit [Hoeflea prorocentri]MCY6381794.1 HlyD family type I secretion periplasmic adaptor subunit [Hoeflea prorocentri]MDA5399594.1 HlyD family type I secretion periplasmic adaptor subunit [Hoeflea prorocentri]